MSKESGLRKIKYVVYFLICTLMILTSCGNETNMNEETKKATTSKFATINSGWNGNDLKYDTNTLVIYYRFDGNYGSYMCPYYSENGKLCRYIDGRIVEIEQENESED